MTTSENVRQVASLAAAGFIGTALVLAVAFPAHGTPLGQNPVTVTGQRDMTTERVPFGDLALTTRAGQHALYRRVSDAVYRVCPVIDEEGVPYDSRGCMDFAWDGARPQIDHAIKAAKSGAPLAAAIVISSGNSR
jgi:UrcA family protein